MPRTVQIGRGRRVTIAELVDLSSPSKGGGGGGDDDEASAPTRLEPLHCEGTFDTGGVVTEAIASLGVEDDGDDDVDDLLSAGETIASLTLLAFTIAQGHTYPDGGDDGGGEEGRACEALIALVNGAVDAAASGAKAVVVRLPRDPDAYCDGLEKLGILPSPASSAFASPAFVRDVVVPRCITLAVTVLAAAELRMLSGRAVVDSIAALSAEGIDGVDADAFAEVWYDARRPHREMCDSASALRVLLEGSTFVTPAVGQKQGGGKNKKKGGGGGDNEQPKVEEDEGLRGRRIAVECSPSSHGPARELVSTACKALELEMNSSFLDGRRHADSSTSSKRFALTSRDHVDAVLGVALTQLHNGAVALLDASRSRAGAAVPVTGSAKEATYPMARVSDVSALAHLVRSTVVELRTALQTELRIGLRFVSGELRRSKKEHERKEKEKAERAAAHAAKQKASEGDKDEFAGMSEERKAKILQKRAEKEAKAAAKAAAKAEKEKKTGGVGANPFGVGTGRICVELMSAPAASSPDDDGGDDEDAWVESVSLDPSTVSTLNDILDGLLRGGVQRKPKIPKGTRDYLPDQMSVRDEAFQIIRRVFKRHGAVEIDTPVFELKETLTGKYGEDSKLIYDLADQGGELLSLRYDLTVPFARFLALHTVGNVKRFHIGKVYRRDQPALARGRYREFYQCDFDIAGTYGRMVPDAECVGVVIEILAGLPIGEFMIKINHRRLLDAILDICGVPPDKFRTICSAVDKLDKEPWEEVRREMVDDKGLSPDVADQIGTFVVQRGAPWEMYKSLMEGGKFGSHEGAKEALEDMRILFGYLEAMGRLDAVSFDMSLARGLDYYTGVIYEAVSVSDGAQVGSIGGGGRYDDLVSMFQEAGKITPCVGVSVGIERVFTLMEAKIREERGGSIKRPNVSVLVASVGENMMAERMRVARLLWDANISAEYSQQDNPKLKYEITNALDREIPYMVIVGEEELRENKCKVKDLNARSEDLVPMSDLVRVLRERGVVPVGCELAMEMMRGEQTMDSS